MGSPARTNEYVVRERINIPYVERVAGEVAAALDQGEPIQVAFQPGDGTFYRLVFTPLSCRRASPAKFENGPATDHIWNENDDLVVCSWLEYGAYILPGAGSTWMYVEEKWPTTSGSAACLAILFNEIAKRRP